MSLSWECIYSPLQLDRRLSFLGIIKWTMYGTTQVRGAQKDGRCPIPGNIQGQVGRGSEQSDLVEGVPAHCRGVGLDDLWRSLPTPNHSMKWRSLAPKQHNLFHLSRPAVSTFCIWELLSYLQRYCVTVREGLKDVIRVSVIYSHKKCWSSFLLQNFRLKRCTNHLT